jgi:hypothetical protein
VRYYIQFSLFFLRLLFVFCATPLAFAIVSSRPLLGPRSPALSVSHLGHPDAVAASSRRDPDADPRRPDRPRSVRPRPRLPSPVPIAFDSPGFLGTSRLLAPDFGVLVRGLVIIRPTRRTSAR